MPQRRPSENLFQTRLEYLIRTRGIEGVVRLTGRSPQTIRRWQTGSQRPSARVARSVARQGRTPETVIPRSARTRNPDTGRIVYREYDLDTILIGNREDIIRERMRVRGLSDATSDRERRMIERRYAPVSSGEMEDFQRLMEERDNALDRGPDVYDSEWWDDWRERLEESGYSTA